MQTENDMWVRSYWKSRGIKALCLIVGLLVGLGAGFLVQKKFLHFNFSFASTARAVEKEKAAKSAPENGEESSTSTADEETASVPAPVATAPVVASTVPQQIPAKTPAQAMSDYLRGLGKDPSGMIYGVVAVSRTDPNWKLDKGSKGKDTTLFFIVRYVNGGWVVVDSGTGFTAEQLAAKGAPGDLLASTTTKTN